MAIRSQSQLPGSPDVRYMHAPALFSDGKFPTKHIPLLLGLLLVALLIGGMLAFRVIDEVVYADQKNAERVQEAISAVQPQPIPLLADHRNQGSEELRAVLQGAGLTLKENPITPEEGVDQLDVDKLPANTDQSIIDAANQHGIDKLPPPQAASYLMDYWNLTLSRTEAIDLRIRFQLFGPATVEQAIVKAVEAQGWQGSSIGESGTDQMGNTYQHGTIDYDGKQYRWSVYACPLKDVYPVSGLPESSWYLSARLMG